MYCPTSENTWKGRTDHPDDLLAHRWHQKVQCIHLESNPLPELKTLQKGTAILGYCCDAGVVRNEGRAGAKEGPAAIRQAMASLANHFEESHILIDAGDVVCENNSMENAQETLSDLVCKILNQEYFPFLLGGGHDMAYGHFMGLVNFLRKKNNPLPKIGIINFDAHFDLREPTVQPNSGTPFFQIHEYCEQLKIPFRYMCLGIQPCSNTKRLFDTAQKTHTVFITAEKMNIHRFDMIAEKINAFLKEADYCYVTIDMDGFAAAHAPGVSAPAHSGYLPDIVFACLNLLKQSGKIISMDIAETNPRFDIDNRTARLAAVLAHTVCS